MASKATFFTKVGGLASVIWDPENDQPLIEFNREGLVCIKDSNLAKKLAELGYMEVSADQITKAGLTLPNIPETKKGPGKGYTHDSQNPLEGVPNGVSGESPMEAYLKHDKDVEAKGSSKGRTIVQ